MKLINSGKSGKSGNSGKSVILHVLVIILLFILQFILPEYHHLIVTRVMILAIFAMGFNVLFGYTGLLSLGHALFFATGLYAAGLTVYHFEWHVVQAFVFAIFVGAAVSAVVGFISLHTTNGARTGGVAFMIVTLMFAQLLYLATIYFAPWTRGDEGLILPASARSFDFAGMHFNLINPTTRYFLAWGLLALSIMVVLKLVTSATGKALIAIRENPARTDMLGYNIFALKLYAVIISGTLSATAGAAYALLFSYIGSSFAGIQYSIDALLFTLLGGAGTVLGPLLGSFVMFYVIDIASDYTSAYHIVTGIILIVSVLFFRKGILGTIRDKWISWLP